MSVKVWSEKVSIPTYQIGTPEKNPIFLEKRVYQGSSGKVYPHPVIEKISNEKIDKEWSACYLENEFIKIMILPELGGRVQMAYDKTKKRHFVYYNEVIKPALVGLTGPWISGGIEFNWPQHHRPSTYGPVDYYIEENADGSKTVWCNEIERMSRTKGMAGFTIYPNKTYLEIKVKLYNRTTQPQSFLWWANPAVAVNDYYQSVFPPDVNAVFDHGKRDVSDFPIATGTYYKFDYSPGTDISRYKNIPVPTSYMAIKSDYNFVGGYENDTECGLLHVANHHVSPGKKQWTWGNGDFGKAWDRNLTDTNGPYIELMCGVYTDNQPDFSWLMPYEEKAFTQYFMPYQDIGVAKNASKDVILNLEFEGAKAILKVCATGIFSNAVILLTTQGEVLLQENVDFKPGMSYYKEIEIDKKTEKHLFYVSVVSAEGRLLLDWKPKKKGQNDIPVAAQPAIPPKDIMTNEELYLNGLHLEQYRHATYDPREYYEEALRRDSDDIRCNNALGLWFLRRGKFSVAESYFQKAFQRQTNRNPNPYDGEPLFNLGLSLRYQEKNPQAYDVFYKSVWNAAYMDSGYFQLAQIDAINQNWELALDTVERSLIRNWHNHKARHLKVAILRKMGEQKKAIELINESLVLDHFNFGMYFEHYLFGDKKAKEQLLKLMRNNIHNYVEISLDYAFAGMYNEAVNLLDLGIAKQPSVYPMALYYKAWFLSKAKKNEEALQAAEQAEQASPDYCFPNRIEAVQALEFAMYVNPKDSKAPYYLGNFWYDARQYNDAISCWEKSVLNNNVFPTVHRNLALAYYNKMGKAQKALKALETAFELDKTDARVFMELDQLYKKLNKTPEFRLKRFEEYSTLVEERDDLYIEKAYLYILKQQYTKAYDWIMKRKFHPWEGGEGKVTLAYTKSCIGIAQIAIENNNYDEALAWLDKVSTYPYNLGEGKLEGVRENEIEYWRGCVYQGMKNMEKAKHYWLSASKGESIPTATWFYNDQPSDAILFQGLALSKLAQKKEARKKFEALINYGHDHISDDVKIDYFAVSLPNLMIWEESLKKRNEIHCNYLIAMGYMGKGNTTKASQHFNKVFESDCAHIEAATYQNICI